MTNRSRLAPLLAILAALPLALPPSPARAQTALRLDGACQKLIIAGRDLSGSCVASLTNAVSRNRTSFDFTASDGESLSFSGNGAQREATEETGPLQPINLVAAGPGGMPTLAVGACRFSTPEPGRTVIVCEANAADGRVFAGTFVTVAKAPPGAPAR